MSNDTQHFMRHTVHPHLKSEISIENPTPLNYLNDNLFIVPIVR